MIVKWSYGSFWLEWLTAKCSNVMPYRRLPNTDQARVRALRTFLEKADSLAVYDFAVTLQTLSAVRSFLPKLEMAQRSYTDAMSRQSQAGRTHLTHAKMARLYVSHFIQVLNLAVIRGEVRPVYKQLYGLDTHSNTLPDLSSEASLVEWGNKVIVGEQRRLSQGGVPIYNPTIAKVKVHYDIFLESYERQHGFQAATARALDKVVALRAEADRLILDVWNQVEAHFSTQPSPLRRMEMCRAYGVVYYYRTGEKQLEEV